jgi:hypothetical protein
MTQELIGLDYIKDYICVNIKNKHSCANQLIIVMFTIV